MEERSQPGRGGAYHSAFFIEGSREEAAYFAELRQRLGDEAVEQLLRNRELMRHPRPLMDDERSVVEAAITPVLDDLRAAGAIVPEIRYESWQDRESDYLHAFIGPVGQSTGMGVSVALASSQAERLARLAGQVQEWEVEELCALGRPATWPECPTHPGTHPLEPVVGDDSAALWRCPRSGLPVCAIGELRQRP
ncbi:MAG TPA: hypothetical protein VIZ43_16210 [Trebonia sp.]